MKQWGAGKSFRISESIIDLEAALDRKARHAALMEISESQRRRTVADANMKAMGHMVAMLLEADRTGDLATVAPVIERIGNAVGTQRRTRPKR